MAKVKNSSGRYEAPILVRLTPEQRAAVQRAAEAEGQSMGSWARRVLTGQARVVNERERGR